MDSKYEVLLNYPEFQMQHIMNKHRKWVVLDSDSGDGDWQYPEWIFDPKLAYEYILLVYAEDSPLKIKDFSEKKKVALHTAGVPGAQWDEILANRNFMIGDMVTRFLREFGDFNYELLISTKEAIEALLEVVRKPVDTRLLDDKERNAIKAKKESYLDARFLMDEVAKMMREVESQNPDVAEYVNKSVFRGGVAERLALKGKEKQDK